VAVSTRLRERVSVAVKPIPAGESEDVRAVTIPWRRVGLTLVVLLAVLASWAVTTNTYSVLWQQRLASRWDATVARGEPLGAITKGSPVARISIPSLGLERVVLEGIDRATLRKAPGHQPGTALPGEIGNSVIRAHRLIWSAPFGKLQAAAFGAPVHVQLADGSVRTYLIAGIFRMDPGDPELTADASGMSTLSLVTSDPPFRADQILVVKAVLPPSEEPA
jgi:LPXTG-site transpeptidase (sortase) family protein